MYKNNYKFNKKTIFNIDMKIIVPTTGSPTVTLLRLHQSNFVNYLYKILKDVKKRNATHQNTYFINQPNILEIKLQKFLDVTGGMYKI